MIRLTRLYIKGFKDEEREIDLHFSEEPISVIFGPNGSGKTTLLKVLQAVLKQDFRVLHRENIKMLRIEYQVVFKDGKQENHYFVALLRKSIISLDLVNKLMENKRNNEYISMTRVSDDKFEMSEYMLKGNLDSIMVSSSIFFGIHRGLTSSIFNNVRKLVMDSIEEFSSIIKDSEAIKHIHRYSRYMYSYLENNILANFDNELDPLNSSQHIHREFTTIQEIGNAIIDAYERGHSEAIEKTASAFFETIEAFENVANNQFSIDKHIEHRIRNKINFIRLAIEKQSPSSLKAKLENYLKSLNSKYIADSKISRALLINILEKAEEPNPALDAVNKLLEIFNGNLQYGKRLVIDQKRVFIGLLNNKSHSLEDLSSGERNLLSMLTLFLIIGQGRDFLIIDEPEISMNLEWQRKFLPLLSELNPQAQIIVASHSPAIASNNSRYLVELK